MLSRLSQRTACNNFLYWKMESKKNILSLLVTYGKEVICLQWSTPRLSNVLLDHRDGFLMRTFQIFQIESIPLWLGCGLNENYENLSVINQSIYDKWNYKSLSIYHKSNYRRREVPCSKALRTLDGLRIIEACCISIPYQLVLRKCSPHDGKGTHHPKSGPMSASCKGASVADGEDASVQKTCAGLVIIMISEIS